MNKSDITKLTKELVNIKNLKVEIENIDRIPFEQEISKKKKVKNLQCSILFVDIRNSTKMQDENGKKNMVKIYKMFARLVTRAIEDNKGKVMQIVGDGMLCIFANKDKNSGQHAIDTVKSINTYIEESYNPNVESLWKIKCGFGVCSGHVLMTRIGTRGKNKCCQMAFPSSVTNYASKYCGHAKGGQVVFDNETFNQLDKGDQDSSQKSNLDDFGQVNILGDIAWTI